MKILLFADSHISGRNPRSRIDNYYQSCLQKFDEIIELSKKVDIIICVGDFWDSPIVANTLVDDILDRIEENKKDFYFIYGSHDTLNYNIECSASASLSHMIRRSKYVKHLKEIEDKNIYIKGCDCIFQGDQLIKDNGIIHNSDKKFTLVITHQFITIKPFLKEVLHVQAKDIKTNYDIIYCSHFHYSFDETINGHRFINLNSIGRTDIREQHQPQIAILNTENGQIEKIKLKSAKKPEDIFDLSKYEEIKKNEKSIEDFIASLNSATWQASDLVSQIKIIGEQEKVEQKVIEYGLNLIAKIKQGDNNV